MHTFIVDSFTDQAFKGNPAGVCILSDDLSDHQMLHIAKELSLSETAFLKKEDAVVHIRFFSPKMEIPLCGHATLASAKVLFANSAQTRKIHFKNKEGLDIVVHRDEDEIIMDFPVYDTRSVKVVKEMLHALGIKQMSNAAYNEEMNILLIEIADSYELKNLKPNYEKLVKSHDSINGVVVTAKSQKADYDFESRYFWPWSGTNEDPVTGGTHTFLAIYWGERLDKKKMNSYQCSERGGFMTVEICSDSTMTIRSNAVIVLEGKLKL